MLVLIFKACVSTNIQTQFYKNSFLPTRLLRVCKKWNSIVVKLPYLWTSLFVEKNIGFDGEPTLKVIERRLSRTDDLGIALSIGFEPGAFMWNRSVNIPWWKVVHLELEDQNLHPHRVRDVLGECASLKTCSLMIDGFAYAGDDSSSDGSGDLDGGYVWSVGDDCSEEEDSGWVGENEEDRSGWNDNVDGWNDNTHYEERKRVVILPALKMLSVVFDSQLFDDYRTVPAKARLNQSSKSDRVLSKARISPFFDGLELPALKDLTIAASHSAIDNELLMALIDLSVISCFQLVSLEICNIRIEADGFHRLLLNLTSLESLCVKSPNFGQSLPDLIEYLEYVPEKAAMNILPGLEVLTILDHVLPRDHKFTDETSLRVLESRWWTGKTGYGKLGLSRLRRANISWDYGCAACYLGVTLSSQRAEILRNQGLDLKYPTLD
ncbi:hypothetical protein BDZ94DRAFT_1267865 [Collybia nuda]|uniref:F-box domain-containing protein n=1 Tax=Collybia nuda TaxID=64659 RepID=A0A9P6CBI5_9AGAR|nr:hypothetical protein BDZ94DRAFT_1267865 [Collybia nuda]